MKAETEGLHRKRFGIIINGMKENGRKIDWYLPAAMLLMLCGYVLIHDLLGGTLFSHCGWDSYTLQALAWRRGAVGLGQDYSWLELAVYNGDWFVSFPPLPSVVLLPLTLIWGENTPNNLLVAVYAMLTVAMAYKAITGLGMSRRQAAFAAVFLVWGSNAFWMSTSGGVWFQAQCLNLLLGVACVYCAFRGKRYAAYILAALAVGCRPFSICLFPVLAVLFISDDMSEGMSFFRSVLSQLPCLIAPALIGGAYMAYNYARFGNILEFGHNYLPEFTASEKGQFDLSYIGENLYNIWLRPVLFADGGSLEYPVFDGFMFYIANPVFILFFARIAADAVKRRFDRKRAAIAAMFIVNMLLLCAHKTFGGWQFGARYTVDLIPYAFLYILLGGRWKLRGWEMALMAFAIMFNAYGALSMTFLNA